MSWQSRFRVHKGQRMWAILLAVFTLATLLLLWHDGFRNTRPDILERFNLTASKFDNFNNETGAKENIVPNIVHFILFEDPVISFPHFVCILAAMRNHRPENIYFHTNLESFQGQYWQRLMSLKQFTDIVVIKKMEMPTEIFNQTIRLDRRVFHGGDIARIRVLMEYGGIYLDNDSYIVKNMDFYRRFEMALGWDENQSLGTQILVAHKDARFLKLWLHTYDGAYYTDLWYYNAGELPTTSVLDRRPDLIHRVKVLFGVDTAFYHKLFQGYWAEWRKNYAFHLLARKYNQQWLKNISTEATYPVDFDEYNLQKYPITFREMANEVLDYEKSIRSSK